MDEPRRDGKSRLVYDKERRTIMNEGTGQPALNAPAAAVGDWVMVPREPTPEMIEAALREEVQGFVSRHARINSILREAIKAGEKRDG